MKRLLLIIPILLLLISCSTKNKIVKVPVPVETIKTEYIHDLKIDSVFVRDSIDRWREGDTIYIYKEHTHYKYLNKTDTVIKIDTIPKIVKVKEETIKEVEKKVPVEVNHIKWYQKGLMWIGLISILLIVGFIIYKIKK